MKKCILLIIIALAGQILFSQNFVSENKQWSVKIFFLSDISTELFKLEGDSVLNSQTYKKMLGTYDPTGSEWYFAALIREENNKVYLKMEGQEEGLIYNFNAEAGDTVETINLYCRQFHKWVITEINMVNIWGMERKQWKMESLDSGVEETWLEGIGSLSGPVYSGVLSCVTDPEIALLCFYENDELLYRREGDTTCYVTSVGINEEIVSDIRVYPNPSGDNINIDVNNAQKIEFKITNLQGKVLLTGTFEHSKNKIDIGSLSKGTYLLYFSGSKNKPVKFVKGWHRW